MIVECRRNDFISDGAVFVSRVFSTHEDGADLVVKPLKEGDVKVLFNLRHSTDDSECHFNRVSRSYKGPYL